MASPSRTSTGPLVAGTAVGNGPLEDLEMASLGCPVTSALVPGTAVGAQPLEHVAMASPSCITTGRLVPRAAVGPRPLQHLEMAALGGKGACPHGPSVAIERRTAVDVRPLHDSQMTFERCIG